MLMQLSPGDLRFIKTNFVLKHAQIEDYDPCKHTFWRLWELVTQMAGSESSDNAGKCFTQFLSLHIKVHRDKIIIALVRGTSWPKYLSLWC